MLNKLSIKSKILFGFLLMIFLSTSSFLLSYSSIKHINALSTEVIPLNKHIGVLNELIESTDSLESMIELYLLVGSEEQKNTLLNELDSISEKVLYLKVNHGGDNSIALFEKTQTLQLTIINFISLLDKKETSKKINYELIKINNLISQSKKLQKTILQNSHLKLQENINSQHKLSKSLISSIVIIVTLMAFLGVFSAFFLSTHILNSLTKLTLLTEKFSEGEYDFRVSIDSDDEFRELKNEFEKMGEKVKDSQSNLKKLNEHLKLKNVELEEKENRISKINQKLMYANEILKDLDQKKDEFISVAAHELKTPLTSIKGFTQLLLTDKFKNNEEKRNKFLNSIDKNSNILYTLILDLVDSSRISLGNLKVHIKEFNHQILVKEIREEIDHLTEEKKIKFSFSVDVDLPNIFADSNRTLQVLRNLITNAIHHTDEGGSIEVKIYKQDKFVQFEVKDNGVGIPEENKKLIFSKFYQVDSSKTRKSGGSGLGLYICNGLIELMGGKIWYDSEVGKGTTFFFTLPATNVNGDDNNE